MKTYQQEGFNLVLKPMMESGNVCKCCDKYEHEVELGADDYECQVCGMLCSCVCHKDAKPEEPPAPEKAEAKPKGKAKPRKAKKKAAKKRPA